MVAPKVRAISAWRRVSMPSARMRAPVSSAWARTALTILATSAVVRPWTSRRSSLITSGRTKGITARLAGSAPTSSRATPQPTARARATAPSRPAGSRATTRSVTSMTTRSRRSATSTTGHRSSGQATPSEAGSQLTNSRRAGSSSALAAAWNAAARQTQSSSATRPIP